MPPKTWRVASRVAYDVQTAVTVPVLCPCRKHQSAVVTAPEPEMPQPTSSRKRRRANTPAAPAHVAANPSIAGIDRGPLSKVQGHGYRLTKDDVAAGPEFEPVSHIQTQATEVHSLSHDEEPVL